MNCDCPKGTQHNQRCYNDFDVAQFELGQAKAPEGYQYTGDFRIPTAGEFYLWNGTVCTCGVVIRPNQRRWIVRKVHVPVWVTVSEDTLVQPSGKTRVTVKFEVLR